MHGAQEAPCMIDLAFVVLGTASILVMIAYASLCDRI